MVKQMPTDLQAAAAALGLEKFKRHIFLCTDADEPKCCPRVQTRRQLALER